MRTRALLTHHLSLLRAVIAALIAALVVAGAAVTAVTAVAATAPAPSPSVVGPDVSSNNHANGGVVNWAVVHGTGGASFALVKATEGATYTNPYFAGDFAAVRDQGMVRGAYHYARPGGATDAEIAADASAEANFFVRTAGTLSTQGDLPAVLDIEQAGTLSPAQLALWTHTWLRLVQTLTGRAPIVYTYGYFWTSAMGNAADFSAYQLWLSSYSAAAPAMVGGWGSYAFWQYTDAAVLAGVNRPVDVSIFNGSQDQLRTLANYPPAPATPSPAPTPAPVVQVASHIVWNAVSSTRTYGYRQVTTAKLLNPAGKPLAGKVLRLCTTTTARVSVCARVRTNAAGAVAWSYTPAGHVSAAVYFDGDATTRMSATRTVTWRVTPSVALAARGRTITAVVKPANGATIYLFAWNGRSWILKARQAPRTGVASFTGVAGTTYRATVGATTVTTAAYAPNYVRAR